MSSLAESKSPVKVIWALFRPGGNRAAVYFAPLCIEEAEARGQRDRQRQRETGRKTDAQTETDPEKERQRLPQRERVNDRERRRE